MTEKVYKIKDGTRTLSTLSVIFCTFPPGTSETGCIASPGVITAPFINTKPGQSMLKHPVASYPSLCHIYMHGLGAKRLHFLSKLDQLSADNSHRHYHITVHWI